MIKIYENQIVSKRVKRLVSSGQFRPVSRGCTSPYLSEKHSTLIQTMQNPLADDTQFKEEPRNFAFRSPSFSCRDLLGFQNPMIQSISHKALTPSEKDQKAFREISHLIFSSIPSRPRLTTYESLHNIGPKKEIAYVERHFHGTPPHLLLPF